MKLKVKSENSLASGSTYLGPCSELKLNRGNQKKKNIGYMYPSEAIQLHLCPQNLLKQMFTDCSVAKQNHVSS